MSKGEDTVSLSGVAVDLNTAPKEDLVKVRGISGDIADVILDLRGPKGELSMQGLVNHGCFKQQLLSDMVYRGEVTVVLTDFVFDLSGGGDGGMDAVSSAIQKMSLDIQGSISEQFNQFKAAVSGQLSAMGESLVAVEQTMDKKIGKLGARVDKLRIKVGTVEEKHQQLEQKMLADIEQLREEMRTCKSEKEKQESDSEVEVEEVEVKRLAAGDRMTFMPTLGSTPILPFVNPFRGTGGLFARVDESGSDTDSDDEEEVARTERADAISGTQSKRSGRASRRGSRSPHAVTRNKKRDQQSQVSAKDHCDADVRSRGTDGHRFGTGVTRPSSRLENNERPDKRGLGERVDSSASRRNRDRSSKETSSRNANRDGSSHRSRRRSASSGSDDSRSRSRRSKKKKKRRARYSSESDTSDSSASCDRTSKHRKSHRRDRHRSRDRLAKKQSSRSTNYLTTSSSETSSEEEVTRKHKHKSPPLPKLQTFDGKAREWKSFLFQFREHARVGHWSLKDKRNRLLACLRGKAVDFIQSRPKLERADYHSLKELLHNRYGMAELPTTARRQLLSMKQEEGEVLDDFGDRVLVKAAEGYPGVPDDTLQTIAVESFLRGCKDRNAAYAAAERKPETLFDAMQEVRDSAANLRAFGRCGITTRKVSFADGAQSAASSGDPQMTANQENMIKFLAEYMKKEASAGKGEESQVKKSQDERSTSPAPRFRSRSPSPSTVRCFRCGEIGHFSRECVAALRCFKCGKDGHISPDCRAKPGAGSGGNDSDSGSRRRPKTDDKTLN